MLIEPKPFPPPTRIVVSAMWVRRQKRVCVLGRAYSDEACSLASGFGVSFVRAFVTTKTFSLEPNQKKQKTDGKIQSSQHKKKSSSTVNYMYTSKRSE